VGVATGAGGLAGGVEAHAPSNVSNAAPAAIRRREVRLI
jgi:hypothetical protein